MAINAAADEVNPSTPLAFTIPLPGLALTVETDFLPECDAQIDSLRIAKRPLPSPPPAPRSFLAVIAILSFDAEAVVDEALAAVLLVCPTLEPVLAFWLDDDELQEYVRSAVRARRREIRGTDAVQDRMARVRVDVRME